MNAKELQRMIDEGDLSGLLAEVRRIAEEAPKPKVQAPNDVAEILMGRFAGLEQEHLDVVLLDTKNGMTGIVNVYKGSLNSSLIRIGEVFKEAVRTNAASIIVAHNHPSGDPSPSPEDIAVTRAIVQAGKLLDIEVLDHIVVGEARYVSLKAKGLGFDQ